MGYWGLNLKKMMYYWSSDFDECNGSYAAFVDLLQKLQSLTINFIGVFLSALMFTNISDTVTN